jgi:adenylylsulfate kinase-like enzyme
VAEVAPADCGWQGRVVTVIVVTGIQAAGKSTIAQALTPVPGSP